MAIHEIRVHEDFSDPHAHEVERQASHQGLDITGLRTSKTYYVEGVDDEQAVTLAEQVLSDPVTQTYTIGQRQDCLNR